MPYVKKAWVNNTTPFIDATNLNTGETGIYNGNIKGGEAKTVSVISQAITLIDANYVQGAKDIIAIKIVTAITGGAITININAGGALNLKDSYGINVSNLTAGTYYIEYDTTYYELVAGGISLLPTFIMDEFTDTAEIDGALNATYPRVCECFKCSKTGTVKRIELIATRITGSAQFIARIYTVTGTVGSTAVPSTAGYVTYALATSAIAWMEDVPYLTHQTFIFDFPEGKRFEMQKDTNYAVSFEIFNIIGADGGLQVLRTSTFVKGNSGRYEAGAWTAVVGDIRFKVYAE